MMIIFVPTYKIVTLLSRKLYGADLYLLKQVICHSKAKEQLFYQFHPQNHLKRLNSIQGSVPYMIKCMLNLAQLCHLLGPLLKKPNKINCTETATKNFNVIKKKIAQSIENCQINPQLDVRVNCDASRSGLDAEIEQNTSDCWEPLAFASGFLNSKEDRYGVF